MHLQFRTHEATSPDGQPRAYGYAYFNKVLTQEGRTTTISAPAHLAIDAQKKLSRERIFQVIAQASVDFDRKGGRERLWQTRSRFAQNRLRQAVGLTDSARPQAIGHRAVAMSDRLLDGSLKAADLAASKDARAGNVVPFPVKQRRAVAKPKKPVTDPEDVCASDTNAARRAFMRGDHRYVRVLGVPTRHRTTTLYLPADLVAKVRKKFGDEAFGAIVAQASLRFDRDRERASAGPRATAPRASRPTAVRKATANGTRQGARSAAASAAKAAVPSNGVVKINGTIDRVLANLEITAKDIGDLVGAPPETVNAWRTLGVVTEAKAAKILRRLDGKRVAETVKAVRKAVGNRIPVKAALQVADALFPA